MTGNRDIHLVAGETRDGYRWVVLGVTSIGALLAALTSGTLVIALPEILRDLHTDLFTLLWIVVGYTLAATVLAAQRRPDRRPGRPRPDLHGRASRCSPPPRSPARSRRRPSCSSSPGSSRVSVARS